jgi:hypothetical protein
MNYILIKQVCSMSKRELSKEYPKNITYKITPAGSLGLLALGDIGLRAWRKVKLSTPKTPKA